MEENKHNIERIDKAQMYYASKRAGKEIEKELDSFAMWSFILSILPISYVFVLFIPVVNIILGIFILVSPIISIILGILSFGRISADDRKYGNGFAIAGIVISSIFVLTVIVGIFLFVSSI